MHFTSLFNERFHTRYITNDAFEDRRIYKWRETE